MPRRLSPVLLALALAAASAALVFFASGNGLFSDLNHWTYDLVVDHAGLTPTSSQVVNVDFDEDTFRIIQQYPVSRITMAEVINRVAAGKPSIIGLDVFTAEPRTPQEDKALQDALTNAGNVILASQKQVSVLPAVRPMAQFCQPENPDADSGFCKENTPGAMGYAPVNLPIDSDGFIRRSFLIELGQTPALSFPLFIATQAAGTSLKSRDLDSATFNGKIIPYEDRGSKTFLIGSWSLSPGLHIPVWMLLQGKIAPGTFENRVVLIGQSSDAARDSDFTPLYRLPKVDGSRLRMGGTQIHAAAVRSLLEGSAVRRVPKLTLWTVTLVLSWLTAWLTLRKQLYLSVFGTLLPIALTMIGSALLYRYDRIWLPMLVPCCSMALTLPLGIAVSFLDERVLRAEAAKQREQIMTLFSRYVDPQVASRVWKNRDQLSLEGEERVATVMFSDIRNFTALSAAKPPAVVLKWLNEYMTAMDEVIRRHDGFLNKYIGDGIMIIFGVPLSKGQQDDARRAVKSAIAMLERVEQLNARHLHDRDFPCISIGIGIHTGPLIAGSIGSQFRLEYSVLGETVNLASRLESCNKEYGTQILMSHATYETVRDQFDGLISLGETKIKGFDDPVQIYTLSATGLAPDHPSAQTHPARVEV